MRVAAAAAKAQRGQLPDRAGNRRAGGFDTCARKASSNAASTVAGAAFPSSLTARDLNPALNARSSARRDAQRPQFSAWAVPAARDAASIIFAQTRSLTMSSNALQFIYSHKAFRGP